MKKLDFSKNRERYLDVTFPDGSTERIKVKRITLGTVDDCLKAQEDLNKKKLD